MTDRPTPEQIAGRELACGSEVIVALREHGYVIVHPDDIPTAQFASADFQRGWYGCRNSIFGEATDD